MDTKNQNIKQTVPFFMVTDMEASLRFYTERLGFAVTKTWTPRGKIEWCWLERDAAAIMLQQPRKPNAEQQGVLGGGVTIAYQCLDALELYREFTARGVVVGEPFVGNNMWVVAFKDPDGYRLDFESPTDVAEETKYSDWIKNER